MFDNLKKGDTVILKSFTGIKLGVFKVAKVSDKTIGVLKKDGTKMIFSKKSGKQLNMPEGKENYANSVIEDDGSYEPPKNQGRRYGSLSKKKKPTVPKIYDDIDIWDDVEN